MPIPNPPRFEVHPHAQRTGLLLSFSVGVPAGDRCSVLDLHQLVLNDDQGLGMVGYLSHHHAAVYHWPRRDRGTASLLAFLVKTSLHYVAGKFRLDQDYDPDATEKHTRIELEAGNPEDAENILRDLAFNSRDEFMEWVSTSAPRRPGRAHDRFRPMIRVEPFFHAFYLGAWPWLKAHQAEVEALLYPNGIPA